MNDRIRPPSKPRTANPRIGQAAYKTAVPYSARAIRPSQPIIHEQNFLEQLEDFIKKESAVAHSDSDRVNVYKRAFEKLISEFTLCRPLISKIKQQYDEMSSNLLEKHREMVTDSSSVTQNEDQFSELVNKMRRAKAKEFKQCNEESEKLLDEMTELRLQRSDLLKQLDEIATQRKELKSVAASHYELLHEKNSEYSDIAAIVKQIENQKIDLSELISSLEDNIQQIKCSEQELNEKDALMKKKLEDIQKIEEDKKAILEDKLNQLQKLDIEVQDMNKDVIGLQREKKAAEERLKNNKLRKENNEAKIREMLLPYNKRQDVPIVDIVKKLLGK